MLAISPDWLFLAEENAPVSVAAAAMKCSATTAAKRLGQARGLMAQTPTRRQADAVALLEHSGLARPMLSKRRWTDIVLGLTRAA